MPGYQHYSFDLWLTLIKSNPDFKLERAKYFFCHYNPLQKTLEQVQAIFRQVDVMCNAINEKTGGNIDAEEMYLMVICQLAEDPAGMAMVDVEVLYDTMEELLFDYLPQLYCNNTPGVLQRLKEDPAKSLNILSKTGFIKGKTLRRILQELSIGSYFDFQLYSDELGLSKPNKILFEHLLHQVHSHRGALQPASIIHIGDNPLADIAGAKTVGISSLLVNSNQQSILTLLEP